jgi:hypothetical protein
VSGIGTFVSAPIDFAQFEASRRNATMGGTGGFVRGKTKIEVYKRFRAEINRKRVEESTGLYMDAGKGTKPEVYAQMKRDPGTGEWVLFYHFGK